MKLNRLTLCCAELRSVVGDEQRDHRRIGDPFAVSKTSWPVDAVQNSEAKPPGIEVVRTELLCRRLQTNFDLTGNELLFSLSKLGGRYCLGLAGAQNYTE